jgi:hypothetical protein
MTAFHLTGIENATLSKDRSQCEIQLRTNKGPLGLTISAQHLDALITSLQGIEYHASLIDPTKGALPGEPGQIRAEIVSHLQVGVADQNGTPSVLVGLKSAQVFRWFALDRTLATSLQRAVEAEIPKLQTTATSH